MLVREEFVLTKEWQTIKPPNEKIVEVEYDNRIIRVKAIWGRDGIRAHWESEDGDLHWSVSAFTRWREITKVAL